MPSIYENIPTYEADEIDTNTAQQELRDALTKKNLKYFEIALDMGADPLMPNDHKGTGGGACVYEIALSTYGYGKFVELCLENGCSAHYINPFTSKAAINYAIDSKDPQIINILLRHRHIQLNRKFSPLSPVNSLIINANNDNVDNVIVCLKSLLNYGARVNIPDQSKQTPFYYLEQNSQLNDADKIYEIQQILSHHLNNKMYSHDDDDVIRPMHMINGDLRAITVFRYSQSKDAKFLHVTCGNLEKFREQFMESELSETDKISLLLESIQEDEDEVLDFLLENHVDYNGKSNEMSPLLFALTYGNSYALKRLLDQGNLDMATVECPLIMAITKMAGERQRCMRENRRCFYLLLNSKRVDINEKDSCGNTPLYWALYYHIVEATRELLKRGAYIGSKNYNNIMPLEFISSKHLQECFDNCIFTNAIWGQDNFEIQLNYDNIRPPQREKSSRKFYKEMAPITFIAESEEHRHLLLHPLISIFLFLKWRQLSFKYYNNLAMYLIFAFSFMLYTTLRFSSWEAGHLITFSWLMTLIGILYMLGREFLQFLKRPKLYFYSLKNHVELLIIILAIISCIDDSFHADTQKTIAVCTMLLIAVELFLLLGYLPVLSMSTHMLMLEAVCLTFLKSFMLYSVFLITFSICFYTLFNRVKMDAEGNARSLDEKDGDDSSNQFSSPLKTLIKTIVMMTGEFDSGDIEFDSIYSYLVFLLFVFFMTIVLYNLLNGLAVSDIQAIKGYAELNGAICRIKWLTRNEGNLNGHSHDFIHLLSNYKWLRPICHRFLYRYPNYRQISILPYCNRIRFVTSNDDDEERGNIPNLSELPKLDPAITKMAMDILEQNRNRQRPQSVHMRGIENRFDDVDKIIGEMYEILKNIQKENS